MNSKFGIKLIFPLLGLLGLVGWTLYVRSHEAVALTMERIQQEPDVVEALGPPVEMGLLTFAKYSSGDFSMTLPLSGTKASGKVLATATDEMGPWKLISLTVYVDGQPSRTLSPTPPPAPTQTAPAAPSP